MPSASLDREQVEWLSLAWENITGYDSIPTIERVYQRCRAALSLACGQAVGLRDTMRRRCGDMSIRHMASLVSRPMGGHHLSWIVVSDV